MALTRKALSYLVLAYGFMGLGLVLREPALTTFVIPIAVLLFYSTLHASFAAPKLTVTREVNPPRSFGGETVKITVKVRNDSPFTAENLVLTDMFDDSLVLESGSNVRNLSLMPGENFEFAYRVSASNRGRHIVGPMRMRIRDLLGFRAHSSTLPIQDQILILPHFQDLGTLDLRARRIGPWPGNVPSRTVGPGSEFFELTLYTPGDELRRINWKASAKRGRLVANQYEAERVTDVLVVVDCSEGALSEFFPFKADEFQITLAASLCSQLLLQGNRVGLLAYGAERTWAAPAFGKRQLVRILGGLAVLKSGKPLIPIGYAVETIVSAVLPARSVIIFISPVIGNDVVDVIRDVAGAGFSVFCFTPPNPVAEAKTATESLARRIIGAERRANMSRIGRVSKLVQVSQETPIRVLLRRSLAWRPA